MIVKDLIQRIQSLYSHGVQSDDTRLSPRHIYSVLVPNRAKLLVQKINKRQRINQSIYQTVPCVELVKALPYECPCVPPLGCTIYRTKYQLPELLSGHTKHAIQSVTSLVGDIIYSETSWTAKKYQKGLKYTSHKPDYYIRNNYLYITHKGGPDMITITALFQDPIQAEKFSSQNCNEDCEDCDNCVSMLDRDFPISRDLVDTLIQMCLEELLNIFSKTVPDNTNNTTDSNPEQSK